MTFSVLQGDVLDALPTLEADSFDAMLTDPPYGLTFMSRDWDRDTPGPDVWRETLRVLKPGAFALIFGGTRTFHRLAVALEDAGFEVVDTLMWVYGSGFPKSHDVSKAIDKLAGAEREVIGRAVRPDGTTTGGRQSTPFVAHATDGDAYITAPATPDAERWQGYGTALKPAYEPILLVRKPTRLTYAQNALEHGTGALNIDGARVPFSGEADEAESKNKNRHADFGTAPRDNKVFGFDPRDRAAGGNYDPPGRWPANLIHDGSEEVVERFPRSDARPNTYGATPERSEAEGYGTRAWNKSGPVYADTGSAARFFYAAKASTKERNAGLGQMPLVPSYMVENGSKTAGSANGVRYDRTTMHRNPHPTVKPLALTEYLATLLLPPERVDGQPRRLLVPFAGVASEVIGGLQAGWDEVVGIEREAEYARVAEARIAHWTRGGQPGLNFAGAALEAEAKQ